MLTIPIYETPNLLLSLVRQLRGGFVEWAAVYVGLEPENPDVFTHARVPTSVIALRLDAPALGFLSENAETWSRIAQDHILDGLSGVFGRTHTRSALRVDSGRSGLIVFVPTSEVEMGVINCRMTFLDRSQFELSANLVAQYEKSLQEISSTRGSVHTHLSFSGDEVTFRYSSAPLDVELFATPHQCSTAGDFWDKALKDNLAGGGDAIGLDHLHLARTELELACYPALAAVRQRIPHFELYVSPGDGHEIDKLKGKVEMHTRGRWSNVSAVSMGVTMIDDDQRGGLCKAGHATFDFDRLVGEGRDDEFVVKASRAYKTHLVADIVEHYELVRRYTVDDANLPEHLVRLRRL